MDSAWSCPQGTQPCPHVYPSPVRSLLYLPPPDLYEKRVCRGRPLGWWQFITTATGKGHTLHLRLAWPVVHFKSSVLTFCALPCWANSVDHEVLH